MDDPQTLIWLAENLRQARLALVNAELVLKHAHGRGEKIGDLLTIVVAHANGIRGLECMIEIRRESDGSSSPTRIRDGSSS